MAWDRNQMAARAPRERRACLLLQVMRMKRRRIGSGLEPEPTCGGVGQSSGAILILKPSGISSIFS